jgi:hypothetical protein
MKVFPKMEKLASRSRKYNGIAKLSFTINGSIRGATTNTATQAKAMDSQQVG